MALKLLADLIENFSKSKSNKHIKPTINESKIEESLLVFGYIQQEISTQKPIVPLDIKSLCAEFYGFYFNGSNILKTMKQRFNLFTMLSTKLIPKHLSHSKLLFKGSRDGYRLDIWLEKLTNNSPYLFIIKSEFGNIFGGFTSVDISTFKNRTPDQDEEMGVGDDSAFIFLLESDADHAAQVFPVIKGRGRVIGFDCSSDNYQRLFYFGFGQPIVIYQGSDKCVGNACHSYNYQGMDVGDDEFACNTLCGGENDFDFCFYEVENLEVYHVPR